MFLPCKILEYLDPLALNLILPFFSEFRSIQVDFVILAIPLRKVKIGIGRSEIETEIVLGLRPIDSSRIVRRFITSVDGRTF